MTAIQPVKLEKTASRELLIEWSDGKTDVIAFINLRKGCQCATCIDERAKKLDKPAPTAGGALPVLTAAQAQPLDIATMTPVGNYGYNITFTDGHSSGIFTFDLLRAIAEAVGSPESSGTKKADS